MNKYIDKLTKIIPEYEEIIKKSIELENKYVKFSELIPGQIFYGRFKILIGNSFIYPTYVHINQVFDLATTNLLKKDLVFDPIKNKIDELPDDLKIIKNIYAATYLNTEIIDDVIIEEFKSALSERINYTIASYVIVDFLIKNTEYFSVLNNIYKNVSQSFSEINLKSSSSIENIFENMTDLLSKSKDKTNLDKDKVISLLKEILLADVDNSQIEIILKNINSDLIFLLEKEIEYCFLNNPGLFFKLKDIYSFYIKGPYGFIDDVKILKKYIETNYDKFYRDYELGLFKYNEDVSFAADEAFRELQSNLYNKKIQDLKYKIGLEKIFGNVKLIQHHINSGSDDLLSFIRNNYNNILEETRLSESYIADIYEYTLLSFIALNISQLYMVTERAFNEFSLKILKQHRIINVIKEICRFLDDKTKNRILTNLLFNPKIKDNVREYIYNNFNLIYIENHHYIDPPTDYVKNIYIKLLKDFYFKKPLGLNSYILFFKEGVFNLSDYEDILLNAEVSSGTKYCLESLYYTFSKKNIEIANVTKDAYRKLFGEDLIL